MVHKNTGIYIIGYNFVKCVPIFAIFAPLGRELLNFNFQQNLCNISHETNEWTLH